jgi:hypothetical protein
MLNFSEFRRLIFEVEGIFSKFPACFDDYGSTNDGKELNQSFFEHISWSWKRKSEEALPRDP